MGDTKEVMPVNKKAKDRLFTKIYAYEFLGACQVAKACKKVA